MEFLYSKNYTVWLQIFDRENLYENLATFCINRNLWNNFHDTILIDYAVIDTGSSSVPDENFRLTSCIRGFHVHESAWTPTHHEILYCSHAEGNVCNPYAVKVTLKSKWTPYPKYYHSSEHSVKAYADDATLISNCLKTHTMVLQQMDQKATDLDLSFKPSKCVSYLFDSSRHSQQGIELSGGITK